MISKKSLTIVFCLLCLLSLLLGVIPNCSAQEQSGLSIIYTEYGQKTVSQNFVTDTDKGLVLVFTVSNTGSQPLSIYELDILVIVHSTIPDQSGQLPRVFTGYVRFNSLNLMPEQSSVNSINVTTNDSSYWVSFSNQNLGIGRYTAEITYTTSQYYGGMSSQPIRLSPPQLDFSVVNPNPSPSSNQGNTNFFTQIFGLVDMREFVTGVIVTVVGGVILAAVLGAIYYKRKRKR